ncbi:MAG: hypothetical protein WC947_04590 [Elusimicrobiota bacterium]
MRNVKIQDLTLLSGPKYLLGYNSSAPSDFHNGTENFTANLIHRWYDYWKNQGDTIIKAWEKTNNDDEAFNACMIDTTDSQVIVYTYYDYNDRAWKTTQFAK